MFHSIRLWACTALGSRRFMAQPERTPLLVYYAVTGVLDRYTISAESEEKVNGAADRPLLLADPQRLEDYDLSRRSRASLQLGTRGHNVGRPVRVRVPEDKPEQQDACHRRPGRS